MFRMFLFFKGTPCPQKYFYFNLIEANVRRCLKCTLLKMDELCGHMEKKNHRFCCQCPKGTTDTKLLYYDWGHLNQ